MQVNDLYSLPIISWEDDHDSTSCRRCLKGWNFLFRSRHHCRYCGELVCYECSPSKIAYAHFPHPVRSCCSCHKVVRVLIEEDILYDDFHTSKATVEVKVQQQQDFNFQHEKYKEEIKENCSPIYTPHTTIPAEFDSESDGDESVFALKDPNALLYDASNPGTTAAGVVLVEMGSPEHTPSRPVSYKNKQFSSKSVTESNSPNVLNTNTVDVTTTNTSPPQEGSQKRLIRHLSSFQKITFENDDDNATEKTGE